MHFGFCLPNNQGIDDPSQFAALARSAEELGYESVWVSEHLFHASYVEARLAARPYYEALTVLTVAAAATQRVRLGTSVLVLPWHHPVRLAKTVATLDALSGGRVILGVGVGAAPDEYAALGVAYEQRGAIADETLAAMAALWSQERPEFRGERYRFSGLPFSPRPARGSELPIWIGGNSDAALRRVVRFGEGWHPLSTSPDALAPRVRDLSVLLERAGRSAQVPVAVRTVLDLVDSPWTRPPGERRSCKGTAQEVIEVVRAYQRAGATHLVLDTNTPDLLRTRELMERFAQEIAPAISD